MSLVAEEGSCPHGWAGSERRCRRHPAQGPVLVTRRGSAVGGGYGDPHKLGSAFPKRCAAALGRGRDSGPTARFPVLRRVPLPRPACTCSAASGSRCGSSRGTVNWIFRGLLSGSMAPGRAAADLGLGRARSLSAALRPRPQPGARLAAPGSARPARLGTVLLRIGSSPSLPAPSSPSPEP